MIRFGLYHFFTNYARKDKCDGKPCQKFDMMLQEKPLKSGVLSDMEHNVLIKSGRLKNFPAVELLRIVSVESLTGAYRLTHERVKAVVYVNEGAVIYAASNMRSQRLSECLQRWNIFSDQQLAKVGGQDSDFEFGETLVKSEMITREQLSELFVKQSQEVLRTVLLWSDGDWEFDGRVRLMEAMHFNIPIADLLLEGARRFPPEFAGTRFSHEQEKIIPVSNFTGNIHLQPVEAFILSRVDIPLQLNELLSISGMPQTATLHALYSLAICGVLGRESWPSPFSDEELHQLHSMEAAIKRVAPKPQAQTLHVPQKTEPLPKPVESAPKPEVDEKVEVEKFLLRVENASNHYEVFGLERSADELTIKSVYHSLVKRFHPDRFHSEAGKPLHGRIQASFAKLSQAYDVLRDTKLRAGYDLRLISGKAQMTMGTQDKQKMAEERFQQAMTAMSQNNLNTALPLFGQAVMLAPTEARYHAQYGRALAKNNNMRKQAESELQTAIKIDDKNVSYRVMLAEFYRDMKLPKRAESEAQRALMIDPNNKEAKRLLDSLQNK